MKRYVKSSKEVYKMNDGNTTAIWVGIQIGSIKPVYIEALFRDDQEASEFKKEIEGYSDIDDIADMIHRKARRAGAEMVRVSTDDDAIRL